MVNFVSYVWPLNLFHQILIALHAQHIQNKNQDHFPRTIGRVGFLRKSQIFHLVLKNCPQKRLIFLSVQIAPILHHIFQYYQGRQEVVIKRNECWIRIQGLPRRRVC